MPLENSGVQSLPRAAAVVLAAGASSRMGTPKALLAFRGQPLVRHAVQVVLDAGYVETLVVTSEGDDAVRAALSGLPVRLVSNPRAHLGIGTSIAAGVRALHADVELMALILGDQPLVTAAHLTELRARACASPCVVVASRYAGTIGVPAVFARSVFPRLAGLPPEQGCKQMIADLAGCAAFIDCPEASRDIDTPDDYATLLSAP